MPSRFFITGTDTGIGKTLSSALLCAALDAYYWKPIQTGTSETTDRVTVRRLAGLPEDRELAEAYRFRPPVSPHLAAQRAGVRIDFRKIQMPVIHERANLIVEGAGGVLVPMNEKQLMVDLMKHLGLPVLLVARTALGTINHTLLSIAALRAARIDLRAVIMSGAPNRDNRRAIEQYGNVRVAGVIPKLRRINRAVLLEVFRKNFDQKAIVR
jgi:dethiobiotin synthase